MINKLHDILLNDPKVKVREIAEILSISIERVVNILHTHLCMRKLWARWVPRLRTIDQKRIRVATLEQNLAYFNRNPKEFLRRFVTMDATWSTTILSKRNYRLGKIRLMFFKIYMK